MPTARSAAILALPAMWMVAGCASQLNETENENMEEVRSQQRTVALAEWDEDDDGTLDRDEFRVWVQEEGALRDVDADDEISEDEFTRGLYERWDTDGDGALSQSEWDAAKEDWFPEAEGAWNDWDADGDSELDLNEVREGMEFDGVYDVADQDRDAIFDDEEVADFFFDVFDFDDDDEIDTTEWDDFGGS